MKEKLVLMLTYHRFHITKSYWLLKHHLVKRTNEKTFEKNKTWVTKGKQNKTPKPILVGRVSAGCQVLTIQELPMIDSHPSHTANELEVWEMVFIAQPRIWIDLQSVVIPAMNETASVVSNQHEPFPIMPIWLSDRQFALLVFILTHLYIAFLAIATHGCLQIAPYTGELVVVSLQYWVNWFNSLGE